MNGIQAQPIMTVRVLKLKFFFGINPASLRSSANIEAIGEEEGQDVNGLIGMVHFRADAAGLQ